jgi:hypothetical protein
VKFLNDLVIILGHVDSTWCNVPKLDEHASDGWTATAGFMGSHCERLEKL